MLGFKVDALVSDGASPNRIFYRIYKLADGSNLSEDGVVYRMWNRFDKGSKIYLFCDVPHLMKTLRNNIENSHGHNNTRNLMVSMKCISVFQEKCLDFVFIDLFNIKLGRLIPSNVILE